MKSSFILPIIALLSLMALNGCVAAAAGAGLAGGYYVGSDERSPGQMAKDAATTAKVKTALVRDPVTKAWDINVDTYEGDVTLKGHVSRPEERSRAEELAWSITGVKAVINHLAVIP